MVKVPLWVSVLFVVVALLCFVVAWLAWGRSRKASEKEIARQHRGWAIRGALFGFLFCLALGVLFFPSPQERQSSTNKQNKLDTSKMQKEEPVSDLERCRMLE